MILLHHAFEAEPSLHDLPPRPPMAPRHRRVLNSHIARASASLSAGGTSRPVRPSLTSPPFAPTCVATTGNPAAMASRIVFETPSASEGRTKQSRPCSRRRDIRALAGEPRQIAYARVGKNGLHRGRNGRPRRERAACAARASGRAHRANERLGEVDLVLDGLHPPHRADQPMVGSPNGQPPIGALPACGGRKREVSTPL